MNTNELQDKASKLLRALEDGDAQRARDMLHGDDALDVALALARKAGLEHGAEWLATDALGEVLDILAAERMARETLKRATGEPKRCQWATDQFFEAMAFHSGFPTTPAQAEAYNRVKQAKLDNIRADLERFKLKPEAVQSHTEPDASDIVRSLAALDHSRAVADHYARGSDEDVEARR